MKVLVLKMVDFRSCLPMPFLGPLRFLAGMRGATEVTRPHRSDTKEETEGYLVG